MFRRTIKLLTLATLIFVGGNISFAQEITEYKTIDEVEGYIYDVLFPAEYCPNTSYSYSNGILRIYDSTFTCVAIVPLITYSLSSNGGISDDIGVYCLSKNLFTNSGKYEFIVVGRFSTYDGNNSITNEFYGIYNEDNELVFDFGGNSPEQYNYMHSYSYNYTWQIPYIVNNKLVVNYECKGKSSTNFYTKVFNIYGNPNSSISSVQQQNSSKLYPNPARQSVTLEYDIQGQMQEMQIMDMQGRVVANYLLDPSQKQVNINTSNYKKGVYIYRYGNNSGKFVVE